MTDREMAISLGEHIVQLSRRTELLKAIVIERGIILPDQFSWEKVAKLVPREEEIEIERFVSSQLADIKKAISDQTPASGAIRALHSCFLEQ